MVEYFSLDFPFSPHANHDSNINKKNSPIFCICFCFQPIKNDRKRDENTQACIFKRQNHASTHRCLMALLPSWKVFFKMPNERIRKSFLVGNRGLCVCWSNGDDIAKSKYFYSKVNWNFIKNAIRQQIWMKILVPATALLPLLRQCLPHGNADQFLEFDIPHLNVVIVRKPSLEYGQRWVYYTNCAYCVPSIFFRFSFVHNSRSNWI